MIEDAQGRKWSVRFKHSPYGWRWDARHGNHGQQLTGTPFATKDEAEADARQRIQSHDAIAAAKEFFRRLREDQRREGAKP